MRFNNPARRQCLNCCKFSAHRINPFLNLMAEQPISINPVLAQRLGHDRGVQRSFSRAGREVSRTKMDIFFLHFVCRVCFVILDKIMYLLCAHGSRVLVPAPHTRQRCSLSNRHMIDIVYKSMRGDASDATQLETCIKLGAPVWGHNHCKGILL